MSGITLDTQANEKSAEILADFDKSGSSQNVLVIQAASNDLRNDVSAEDIYADTVKMVGDAHKQGFGVVVGTALPNVDTAYKWDASDEEQRLAYNKLVRENSAGADAIADVAADPTMGKNSAVNDTSLYVDGVHPTGDATRTYLEPIYSKAISQAAGSSSTGATNSTGTTAGSAVSANAGTTGSSGSTTSATGSSSPATTGSSGTADTAAPSVNTSTTSTGSAITSGSAGTTASTTGTSTSSNGSVGSTTGAPNPVISGSGEHGRTHCGLRPARRQPETSRA